MIQAVDRARERRRIHTRIRRKVGGTPERPRLAVYRTLKHIYAQVVDDRSGRTLVAASSVDGALRSQLGGGGNVAAARAVGQAVAERAQAKGIGAVVFDRGGYIYHGRVKALAEAARAAGLKF
ncbi:MAG: 50S ribosomal protein L18 [Acidobacteria bacterium]|nr:MAG: 50S ribosomal protein L18 [Acidobacteriota bacterium]